jgi:Tfp pilus assembly protein FimT
MKRARSGSTLLEVCVVLAAMGVMLSVVALGSRGAAPAHQQTRSMGAVVRDAKTHALRSREMVSVAVGSRDNVVQFVALPNGRIATDAEMPADSTTVTVLWEAYAQHAP